MEDKKMITITKLDGTVKKKAFQQFTSFFLNKTIYT